MFVTTIFIINCRVCRFNQSNRIEKIVLSSMDLSRIFFCLFFEKYYFRVYPFSLFLFVKNNVRPLTKNLREFIMIFSVLGKSTKQLVRKGELRYFDKFHRYSKYVGEYLLLRKHILYSLHVRVMNEYLNSKIFFETNQIFENLSAKRIDKFTSFM